MICDFAQFYHIFDLRALPVRTLAALSCGLPPESRTMMRESGQKLTLEQTLEAAILDRLSTLVWLNSEDGQKGRNRPQSVLSALTEKNSINDKPLGFATSEEFLAAWNA